MKCPRCQQENDAGAKFCEECAAPLARACAKCGRQLSPTAKFCPECAHPTGLSSEALPAPRFGSPESYIPKHLVEKILTSKAALEGERKQVTVLFADLKGSMELLADRDPEEARKILDPVIERMMEAVHRYEGTVNQVMGDGIMALFGAPLAHEDHGVRACYAALRMQESVKRYAEEARRAHGVNVQIRVGLNSGEVVVRAIGSDLHMDYTAVGQTTHLAARMEQIADPGAIVITPDTLALAEGYVEVKSLGPVPVKGLADAVEVFEVTGAGPSRTRLQAAARRGLTRFVGRDPELEQLRHAQQFAGDGRGQVAAIVGEAGVGKSRLVYEFTRSHRMQGWLILASGSVSYGKGTPYLPLTDLLRAYFRIETSDDSRAIRAKVTGNILTLDEALKEAIPSALWLLDALAEDSPFLGLEPAERRRRTLATVKALLLRESRTQPLVIVFEDLHWIDSETQAFLDSFVESLPATRILLMVNYRPEYQHGWGSKTYYRQLRIDPLLPEPADDLLDALLGGDASVRPLKPLLIERTEGNPLFLEEGVRALVETGTLVGSRGVYRLVKSFDTVAVPATVQTILATRIDRLTVEDKRLLQAAAVIGKDVPFNLLLAITEPDEDALRGGLGRLQAAEFLYEVRLFPELEYTFKHALTHEVAYGSLLSDRKRALHAAIMSAIERLDPDRLVEQVEFLAHHAVRGEMREKAVSYLRQAGAKAAARSANREAEGFFEQALTLLEGSPQTTEVLIETLDTRLALGPVLVALKGYPAPGLELSYRSALALADRLGDRSRRFPALWGLWSCKHGRGEYGAAYEAAERLLEAAREGTDTGELLEARHALSSTLTAMGRPTDAVGHEEAGIALYDRQRHASQALLYGGHDPGACCGNNLAMNRWLLGYPDRALAALTDSIRLAEELKHPLTTALTLLWATWVHHQRGERDATMASGERLVALASEHGFSAWTDFVLVLLPTARKERLESEALARLYRLVEEGQSPYRRVFCLCVLAELYGSADLVEQGLSVLASISAENRQTFYAPEIPRLEGELFLRCPDSSAAEQCFRRALKLSRTRGEKSLELRAGMSLARLLAAQGRRADALSLLAPIYGWFTEGFDTADLMEAKKLLDQLSTEST